MIERLATRGLSCVSTWRKETKLMGLFSRKRVVGTMQLDFISSTQVAVTDHIPDARDEAPYPLWFAFLYAGKLLSNFSPPTGQRAVSKAISALKPCVDPHDELAYNGAMLGVCCERPPTIVAGGLAGRWVYTGKLFYEGDNLLVNTYIARGDEDHFHRAAIDTVFEIVRLRLGEKGGAVPYAALTFFEALNKYGCVNWLQNANLAAGAAMQAAHLSGWSGGEDPSNENRVDRLDVVEQIGGKLFPNSIEQVMKLIAANRLPDSLGKNPREFNLTAWDLVLELTVFSLHLADRIAFHVMGPEARDTFMDDLVSIIGPSLSSTSLAGKSEQAQSEFQAYFLQLLNARTAFYGPLCFAGDDHDSVEGTLFWEAAKLSVEEHFADDRASALLALPEAFFGCVEALKGVEARLGQLAEV
jgi:hypothetical protein